MRVEGTKEITSTNHNSISLINIFFNIHVILLVQNDIWRLSLLYSQLFTLLMRQNAMLYTSFLHWTSKYGLSTNQANNKFPYHYNPTPLLFNREIMCAYSYFRANLREVCSNARKRRSQQLHSTPHLGRILQRTAELKNKRK